MNVFKLMATLGLDKSGYDKGLNDAEGDAKSFGERLKSGLGTAAKATGVALSAAAAGVATLTKSAVESYANYEQLVGGVETLFAGNASDVIANAEKAYKSAGLSANEYMETVTSFSASLLQSLGGDTAAAASYADTAIRDMSDNANKMGTSMESIQTAYQGFAKQNYTMLDNLKLGYGGTKTEMERLILDAENLNSEFEAARDENGDLAMSYADIVDAIHIVQDNMGITGTTAKEASATISGSVASMKSAWQNLVTGIADENADFEGLTSNFADSVVTAAGNILPRIGQALKGIGRMVTKLAPVIGQAIPVLVKDVLPLLVSAASSLLASVGEAIMSNFPTIITVALETIEQLAASIVEALPTLIPAVVSGILFIAQTVIDNMPMFLDMVLQVIEGLAQGILDALPTLIEALPSVILSIVDFFLSAIPQIIDVGVRLLTSLVDALPDIIAAIVAVIPQIIDGVIEAVLGAIPQIIEAGITLLVSLIDALPEIILQIVAAIPEIIDGIITAVLDNLPLIIEAGVDLFVALIENLPEIIVEIVKAVPDIIEGIVKAVGDGITRMVEVGGELISGLWNGISDKAEWLWDKVKGWCGELWGKVKNFFGIHSPSRLFRDQFGKNLMLGFAEGIDRYGDYGIDAMNEWTSAINDAAHIDGIEMSATATSDGGYGVNGRGVQITQNIYAEKMTPAQAFQSAMDAQETAEFLGYATPALA